MDGPNQAMGVDVRSLLKSQSLSPSLREHIKRTDVDGDGMISVDELLKVLETERTLRRERTLLIRIMIALAVACVLIIAAVVGLTYAVVHLSKDTNVKNNVLVSKDTSEAISTASMQATYPLKDWYKVQSMSELEGLTQITVPFGDGISIFTIQDIHLVPNESVRFDTGSENVSITVSERGVFVSGDEQNSTASRRRLMSSGESEGTVSGQVVGRSTGNDRKECSNDDECESGKCIGFVWYFVVLKKGKCARMDKLPIGAACAHSSECESDHGCGFLSGDSTRAECCKSTPDGMISKGPMANRMYYCPRTTKIGQKCFSDKMCESIDSVTYCKIEWHTTIGFCNKKAQINEPCDYNEACLNDACGRPTAADGATKVCCPSGVTSTYGGYDYCTGMAVGETCWADDMCTTGYCQGNGGGIQKGKCQSTSKNNGEACTSNRECTSNACGRLSADPTHPLLCCADGISTYAGKDYCKNLPVGAMCWSDGMCLTGLCKGNLGGLQKGLCSMG